MAGVIGSYESQASLTTAHVTPQVSPSDAARASNNLHQTGEAIKTFGDVMNRVQDFQEETMAHNLASEKIRDIQLRADAENDPREYQKYMNEIDQVGPEYSKVISSGAARMKFDAEHQQTAGLAKFQVQKGFWDKQIKAGQADLLMNIEKAKDEYWSQPDDKIKTVILQKAAYRVDEAVRVGIMTPESAFKLKQNLESDLPFGQAMRDAEIDPKRTRDLLVQGHYNIKDTEKRAEAIKFTENRLDRLDKERDDAIAHQQATVKSEQLAKGNGFTLQDYNDALIQGVYKTPEEAERFKFLAINGVQITAKTNSDTYIQLTNDFFSLGKPDKKRTALTSSTKTAEDIQEFRLKARDANAAGKLSNADLQNFINGTQKIFDESIRKEVEKKKGPWKNLENGVYIWTDTFEGDVEEARNKYLSEFFNRAVVNDEPPKDVLNDIQYRMAYEKYPQLSGIKIGGEYRNKAGVSFEFVGLDQNGTPILKRK